MPHFRKKPIVVEARQVPQAGDATAIAEWCDGAITVSAILIETMEGVMEARPGDWIIKGVHGEFYPCKPDIFAKTYEAVDGPADA